LLSVAVVFFSLVPNRAHDDCVAFDLEVMAELQARLGRKRWRT